ncbi:hypothetical protein AMS68_007500 [Peltaster fructicola]|uniref:2-(3-amino-3-carboxypropyl)histidine synthase subunit 2 n=1 Tax=Peltaster fructicola TaxID=286661 RepID=A0A6H0Y4Q9_9PEZI|nr:hypothetical protein AMS68_007500 [Peltaster fructicola]
MDDLVSAPVLSTPADTLLEQTLATPVSSSALSTEQFDLQYEIRRTVDEIRRRRWKRIALQFPDDMLVDGPRVFDRLRSQLATTRTTESATQGSDSQVGTTVVGGTAQAEDTTSEHNDERLTILGDTSYGACCVDEIAAEHAAADGVVHYGRSCLSPTQRLPVIYVFTAKPLDHDAAVHTLMEAVSDQQAKLCLLADVPWQHHLQHLADRLRHAGYEHTSAPELIHDPSSPLPNRAITLTHDELKDYTVIHLGTPPTSLVLTLTSRVKEFMVLDPASTSTSLDTAAPAIMRRRYASLLRLSSAAVIGILINTLSVKNYMVALEHVQSLIAASGKKAYTFVVGKLNPAKLANFAEVGGWVVIGCWESSLIDSKEFLAPVITPFELEVALMRDDSRIWGQEWISDFQTLLQRKQAAAASTPALDASVSVADSDWQDQSEDDEPPEFDLRTGRYVSHPRPRKNKPAAAIAESRNEAPESSALVQRAKGDLATINGVLSPGAEYLRSKREWQGLGSDFEIEYDRDEQGNIQGASIEEGRSGVARGYTHNLFSASDVQR